MDQHAKTRQLSAEQQRSAKLLKAFVCDAAEETHEKLWREDHAYDLIIPLGYNDDPIIKGRGSAIFLHLAKLDYSGTEGCIALAKEDLLEILNHCSTETTITIKAA